MSTNGSSERTARHRRYYYAPTATKLTREAAEAMLRAKAIPGNPQAKELFKQMTVMGEQMKSDRRSGETTARSRLPAGRRVAFAMAMLLLIATPIFISFVALTIGSNADRAAEYTPIYFPIWAVFAVWVTLDAPALLGLVGPRPDPFGSKSLQLSALGVANLAAMFFFLILTKAK